MVVFKVKLVKKRVSLCNVLAKNPIQALTNKLQLHQQGQVFLHTLPRKHCNAASGLFQNDDNTASDNTCRFTTPPSPRYFSYVLFLFSFTTVLLFAQEACPSTSQ
jgi:hypothetical protein